MLKIYKGVTGSGKTSKLQNHFHEISKSKGTRKSIVFLNSAKNVRKWRNNINLQYIGPLNIYTYFGFIQEELKNRWFDIKGNLDISSKKLEPTFMNVETAHFVMSKYVEKFRTKSDILDYINATSPQIAVQLIDNLNYKAMNCLDFSEMKKRLIAWAGEDHDKKLVFRESIKIMKIFRDFCL
ncbi:MAG: UvrD-helicase domain-containing protein, partial [Bacillota bacterium]